MKKAINLIIIILTALSCKAQSIIVPLGSGQDYELTPDYYLKDVNNVYGNFEGTWKYQNGTTEITFKLKKEEHYQISPDRDYQDLLVGEYQYIVNQFEVANTLASLNSPIISGYEHKISGGVFMHRLPSHCTDNSNPAEVKISVKINHPTEEDTEGIVILRYVNENGIEKLQACIYDNTIMGPPNSRIDIPDGYYEFIKQ